ncbi:hypothetical protein PAHAL_9G035100 [Panicum hallii]|uniref:Uncharacterized protein n=1 Tax=Panicum hallii TaxID=206008 RepID=A0A2T8HZZ2_9POAL|nr:hypothetical protein PAHAL_9G035100 [Panicum hallii]
MRSTKNTERPVFQSDANHAPTCTVRMCSACSSADSSCLMCRWGNREAPWPRKTTAPRTDGPQSPHRGRGVLAPSGARIIARPLAWRLGASAVAPCRSSGLALFTELYQLPYPRCLVGQVSARSSSRGRMDDRATRGVIWPAALAIGPNPREQFADRAVAVHRRRPKVSCRCH